MTARDGGGAGDDATRISRQIGIATDQPAQVSVISKGLRNRQPCGCLLQAGTFVSDHAGEEFSPATLLAGAVAGSEVTYTLVPAAMGRRLDIDRDGNGMASGLDLSVLLSAWGPCSD